MSSKGRKITSKRQRTCSESGVASTVKALPTVNETNIPENRELVEVTMRGSRRKDQTKHLSLMKGIILEDFQRDAKPLHQIQPAVCNQQLTPDSKQAKRIRHSNIEDVFVGKEVAENKSEATAKEPLARKVRHTRHSSLTDSVQCQGQCAAAVNSMKDNQKLQKDAEELRKQVAELTQQNKDISLLLADSEKDNQKSQKDAEELGKQVAELTQQNKDISLLCGKAKEENLKLFQQVKVQFEKTREEDLENWRKTTEQQNSVQEITNRRVSDLESQVEQLNSFHKPKPLPPPTTTCCPETDMSAQAQGADGGVMVQQATP